MAATKKPAKIASDKSAVVIALTNRVCAHCGERIALNKVVTVERISFDARGKQQKGKAFFAVGHPQTD